VDVSEPYFGLEQDAEMSGLEKCFRLIVQIPLATIFKPNTPPRINIFFKSSIFD